MIGINEKIKDYMVNPNTCAYKVNGEYIIDNCKEYYSLINFYISGGFFEGKYCRLING